jgi:2'-5' RNA ligase
MLQYLVIAEPDLAPQDRRRIDAVRAQHDPQQALIGPHFTLVFPVSGLSAAQIKDHVVAVAESNPAIAFRFDAAVAFHDRLSPYSYTFLVPETGSAELVALHDRLYEGPLRRHLNWDIPFSPHVTVGRFEEPAAADQLAAELNRQAVSIAGHISALDLISYDGTAVTPLAHLSLAPAVAIPPVPRVAMAGAATHLSHPGGE